LQLGDVGGDAPGLVASSPAINRIAAIFRMKLETGVGRPLQPHHVVSLVTVDGNIQDPVAGRPSGQRAKFCHGVCGQRYTAFNLDFHFCGAAAETLLPLLKEGLCRKPDQSRNSVCDLAFGGREHLARHVRGCARRCSKGSIAICRTRPPVRAATDIRWRATVKAVA